MEYYIHTLRHQRSGHTINMDINKVSFLRLQTFVTEVHRRLETHHFITYVSIRIERSQCEWSSHFCSQVVTIESVCN